MGAAKQRVGMRPSRGLGAIAPSKQPKVQQRRDAAAVETYAKGKWIQGAITQPGALRKSLGIKEGESIPAKILAKAAKSTGKMGQRARLAETLKDFK